MQGDHSVQPSAAVRLHLEGPIFALLEDWRRSHEKIPSRSKALRLLIERALTARPTARQRSRATAPHYELNSESRDRTGDSPT